MGVQIPSVFKLKVKTGNDRKKSIPQGLRWDLLTLIRPILGVAG